jgi:multiple sugar transport system substrate-binding protein
MAIHTQPALLITKPTHWGKLIRTKGEWLAWCLCLCVCWGLTGCAPTPPKTIIKLAFWGSVEEVAMLKPLLNQFEQQHPQVRIQPVYIPQQYAQKLQFLAASHLLPDVVMLNSWMLPMYASSGQLRPLPAPVHPQDVYPNAFKALSWNTHLWAYPRDLSNLVVYVNTDLLARYGLPQPTAQWTLAELTQLGQQLRHKSRQSVWAISFYEQPALFWLPWVWAFGGRLWLNSSTPCLLPDTAQTVAGLSAYRAWRYPPPGQVALAPTPSESGGTPMAEWFINQKLAFLVSGRWTTPLLRKKANFNWNVWPLPAGPYGSRSGVDATGYAVSARSAHPQLAMALAQFLTQPHALQTLCKAGLIVPARLSVAQSSAFKAGIPSHSHVFTQAVAQGVPTQSHPQWPALSEQLNEGLQPLWTQPQANVSRTLNQLRQGMPVSCPIP